MIQNLELNGFLRGRTAFLIGLSIFMLSFGLRLLYLDAQPIANDEPFTLFWAQQPLSNIWELSKQENNPPLHFALTHVWIKAFGWSPSALRMSSLLFSSLAAMLLFLAGNRHFGIYGGIVAALLMIFSTEHMIYAHELRTYPLLCLLSIAAVDRYLCLVKEPRKWQHYAWLALFNSLLIYTHFLGFWILLVQALAWPLLPDRRRTLGRLLLMALAVVLLYAPNIWAAYLRFQTVSNVGTWVPSPQWTQLYGQINYFLNDRIGTICMLIPIIIGFIWMMVGKKSRLERMRALAQHRTLLISGYMFGIIYLGLYLQSAILSPVFIPRYLIFSSMLFYMAVAGLLHFLVRGIRFQLSFLALILGGLLVGFQLNPSNGRELPQLVQTVKDEGKAPLIICPFYFDKTYAFHADMASFQDYAHFRQRLIDQDIYAVASFADIPDSVLSNSPKLLFLDADSKFVLPENGILEGLNTHYPVHRQSHIPEIFDVHVFSKE